MAFKKIMNFFFEEVEEDEMIDDEQEDIKEELIESPKSKNEIQFDEKKLERTINIPKVQEEFYEVAQKPSTFINLEEVVEKEPAVQETSKAYTREFTKRKVEVRDERPVQYNFNSVISPFSGAKEQPKTMSKTTTSKRATKQDASAIGTVFSPFNNCEDVKRNVKTEKVEEKKEVSAKEDISLHNELPPLFEIDDIIKAPKHETQESNTHQFSIFDEEYSSMNEETDDLSEFFEDKK